MDELNNAIIAAIIVYSNEKKNNWQREYEKNIDRDQS